MWCIFIGMTFIAGALGYMVDIATGFLSIGIGLVLFGLVEVTINYLDTPRPKGGG